MPAQTVNNPEDLDAMQKTWIRFLRRSPGGGNGSPLQYSCLENPMDRGGSRAAVHGVAGVGHNLSTKPPPNQREVKDLHAEDYKTSTKETEGE